MIILKEKLERYLANANMGDIDCQYPYLKDGKYYMDFYLYCEKCGSVTRFTESVNELRRRLNREFSDHIDLSYSCPWCGEEGHYLGGEAYLLDKGMCEIIPKFQKLGFKSNACCEGHSCDSVGVPNDMYISFINTTIEQRNMLNKMIDYVSEGTQPYICNDILIDEPDGNGNTAFRVDYDIFVSPKTRDPRRLRLNCILTNTVKKKILNAINSFLDEEMRKKGIPF